MLTFFLFFHLSIASPHTTLKSSAFSDQYGSPRDTTMIAAVHSMRCGGATGRKILKLLMMAALLGVVEAGGLVRDGCYTFRCSSNLEDSYAGFRYGCSYGCGVYSYQSGVCTATERTPADCDTKCVRQHPRLLLAPVSSSHLRLQAASLSAALRVRFTTS